MAATLTTRRLPGIRFEAQPPALAESLPRMDVAVFVGFAASGPLNMPVAVEDAAQFAAVFGEDAPLVWDRQRGETVYAYLAPAVRAFFRNGDQNAMRTVTVQLQNEDHTEVVQTWKLQRARIIKHVSGPMNARGTDVAMEELTLSFERLEME